MLQKPLGNGPKYINKSMENIKVRLTLMAPLTRPLTATTRGT